MIRASAGTVGISFTPAVAGTENNINGTNGSYRFKLEVYNQNTTRKVLTVEKEVVIIATPYILSSEAELSSITLIDNSNTNVAISPAFSPEVTSYNATTNKVSLDFVKVDAQPKDADVRSVKISILSGADASIGNDGKTVTLARLGSTEIRITVTAEDNISVKAYDIVIARKAKSNVTNTFTADASKHTVVYSGSIINVSKLFTLDTNAGTATYTVTNGSGAANFASPYLTITKAGTFTVSVTTAATVEYNAGAAVTGTLTVNKGAGPAAPNAVSAAGTSAGQTTVSGLDADTYYEFALDAANAASPAFGGKVKGNDAAFTDLEANGNTHIYLRAAATDLLQAGQTQALELQIKEP